MVGSDVFTVVSSRPWCWWSQTFPGVIPALPCCHQVSHWSPWDLPQIGWVVVFFSFASKVEEQLDHTVSSYPVSPDGVELAGWWDFRWRPWKRQQWVKSLHTQLMGASPCGSQPLLPSGGAGSWWSGLSRHTPNGHPTTLFWFS